MRNVAICGSRIRDRYPAAPTATVDLEGLPVTVGLLTTGDTPFDRRDPANAARVLVRIQAFSCNYRDRHLIVKMARHGPDTCFYVIGSEFVGRVVETGPAVMRVGPGDRVVGNGAFPHSGIPGLPPGLPTNHASKELQVFHEAKLMRIPGGMSDEAAAAFSIGAQTVYSMLRRLGLERGEKVLVTAARSNTSLFALQALRHRDVAVYALSSSRRHETALRALGITELIAWDGAGDPAGARRLADLSSEIGGFDAVIDPFFDLYLMRSVPTLAIGGRYISCGLQQQYWTPDARQPPSEGRRALAALMLRAMTRNLQILGNCLGSTEDLQRALDDHAAGRFDVIVDSVHRGDAVGEFVHRSCVSGERFGKVVFRYDGAA
jgi:NADPH:quinone reductase-like Zn-dependent oxidoreductase